MNVIAIPSLLLALVAGAGASAERAARPSWSAPAYFSGARSTKAGAPSLQAASVPMPFIAITPCRLADTRGNGFSGAFGPPALASGAPRSFPIAGQCGIPANAAAVSANVTVTQTAGPGFLTLYPQGDPLPPVSTLNYDAAGRTLANAAVVPLGAGGGLTVVAGVSGTEVILDVNGYYAPVGAASLRRTVVVSPVGTSAENGAALVAALEGIADNSATNPWLVKLEPGIYEVGAQTLTLKPYVDIEGSGRSLTTIGGNDGVIVVGASHCEIRSLKIHSGTTAVSHPAIVASTTNDFRVKDVFVLFYAVFSLPYLSVVETDGNSLVTFDGVTIDATVPFVTAFNIVRAGPSGIQLFNSELLANGGSISTALSCDACTATIRSSRLTASGFTEARGIFATTTAPPGVAKVTVLDSTVETLGSATRRGVLATAGSAVDLNRSTIIGDTATVDASGASTVRVRGSALEGGPVSTSGASVACVGVSDENLAFFATTCP